MQPAIGRSLADCAFRARTGITIIAILREPEPVTGAQPGDVIQAGDTLVTVGKLASTRPSATCSAPARSRWRAEAERRARIGRTDLLHRLSARRAERALVGADERRAAGRSPAPHLSHAVRISNPMGLALSLLVTDCY